MTLPHVTAGEVARAAEQNDLIDTVNSNSGSITSASDILGAHETRLDTLEAAPSESAGTYFGQWTDDDTGEGTTIDSAGGVRVLDLDVPVGTPDGCALDAGTFTAYQAGVWALSISVQYGRYDQVRAVFAASGTASRDPSTARLGLLAGPSMDAQTTSLITRLSANATLSIYAAVWAGGAPIAIHRARGNNLTAVWLGP